MPTAGCPLDVDGSEWCLISSLSLTPTGDMEKHIRLLAEVAADWLAIHQIRKDFYLKLNKTMELGGVVERLSSRLEEEEEKC